MSDHIPDVTKMIGDTPMTDQMEQHAPVGLRRNAAFEQASDLCRQLERELNAANERIESLNRGNAAAERILCELTGCESGRDVPDWIVKKNWELTDLSKAYLELVHKHTLTEERIKRLEEAVDSIQEYWNRDNNERAMEDACWNAWTKAKEAK